MIAEGDHSPGFMGKLLQKDLKLVIEAAQQGELPLPGTAFAQQMFSAVAAEGGGDLGTQAVVRAFEKLQKRMKDLAKEKGMLTPA